MQRKSSLANLNWAEELHEAIGEFLQEHIMRRHHAERLLDLRSKKARRKK
jgi:hypothetical protein